MNGSANIGNAGLSGEMNPAARYAFPSNPQQPVFSPAVRFAPEELSLSRALRLVAYWATIIAIALVMGRSGVSYVRHVWPERPAHHALK
jgi:hypothetical protein